MNSVINFAYKFVFEGMPLFHICLPVYISLRMVYICFGKKKPLGYKTNIVNEYFLILFAVYLMLLFTQTFIVNSGENKIELIPFNVIITEAIDAVSDSAERERFIFNVIGNVMVFVPVGIMCPAIWGGDELRTGKTALFISVLIEVGQLPINRTSDVDDLFLNTTGAVIGYYIWRFFSNKFNNAKKQKNRAALS